MKRWLAGVVLALPLAALAGEGERPVSGWKIRVAKPQVVKIPIGDLPGRAVCLPPQKPGTLRAAAVDPGLMLVSNGKPVPFVTNDAGTMLWFWGEPSVEDRDARGRTYHLRPARSGERPLRLGARAPLEGPKEPGTRSVKVVQVARLADRVYHPVEALDVASLSPLAREGGYWFHLGKLAFAAEAAKGATLRLEGVHVVRDHVEVLPGGRSVKQRGLHAKVTPGKFRIRVGEQTLEVEAPGPGGDVSVAIPSPGRGTLALETDKGDVLVRRASLELETAEPSLPRFRALGPTALGKLSPGTVVIDLTAGEFLHRARPDADGTVASPAGHDIVVFDPSASSVGPSGGLEVSRKTDLREGGADWVAIAPGELAQALEPLAKHRAAQGLGTRIVRLEEIEDEFGDGAFGVEAVREFLAYATRSWRPAPRFVLLCGDAHRDVRPAEGAWLPTALVDTFDNGASASDRALLPGRGKGPSVALGRFPCRTVAEVEALVAKTIAYETAAPTDGQGQLAFVCGEGRFGPMIDSAIEQTFTAAVSKRVPDAFDVDVTYANPSSIFLYPPQRFSARVVERLSQGPLIFDYIGHGHQRALDDLHWGKKRFPILRREDARKVECAPGRNPIVLITACWTGAFDEPERTVGEELVLNPKGAVAVFAATRVSHPFANALLSLELTERLFRRAGEVPAAERPRLGERLAAALDELSLASGGVEGKTVVGFGRVMMRDEKLLERLIEDERHLYVLLGDPALAPRYPTTGTLEAPEKAAPGTTVSLALRSGDPVPIARATLERVRGIPKGIEGLPQGTPPDAVNEPEVQARVLETYGRANDPVLARARIGDGRAELDVPSGLEPGVYVIKAFGVKDGGAVLASAKLEVAPSPAPKKKKYY